jgi:hypothetical protein
MAVIKIISLAVFPAPGRRSLGGANVTSDLEIT